MRILVYLAHPAQYHFIKNPMAQWKANGHEVKVLIKTKDILENLLKSDGIPYTNIEEHVRKQSKLSILKASLQRTFQIWKIARPFHPDILISTSASIAQTGWLLRKPAITVLEDDIDVIPNLAKLAYPFTRSIVVPDVCKVGKWETKKIAYLGYMKLAYLHPKRFVPSQDVVAKYGLNKKYILIRLAQLAAHHDIGIKGLSYTIVNKIIQIAEERGYSVYISSEKMLDDALQKYQLKIDNRDIHHLMAYASLLVSDSQSMSVEAAMLGTPSLRYSDFSGRISVLEELEKKYNLTFGIPTDSGEKLTTMAQEILSMENPKKIFQARRQVMLDDKIDVTAFFTWFIEEYPNSRDIMKHTPDYQNRFK